VPGMQKRLNHMGADEPRSPCDDDFFAHSI
jgi:hypothetical protein